MNILNLTTAIALLSAPMASDEIKPHALYQPVALPMVCQVEKAPKINVRPMTANIRYDKSKTSAELSQLKTSTVSPYGLGVDQTTGGLRHDQPTIETTMRFLIQQDSRSGSICLSYDTINVDIKLQPKIYIAREFNTGRCAREVLAHEKKHVAVDRAVINKYAKKMGTAIQQAVNKAGALGPFPAHRQDEIQAMMQQNISSALNSVTLALTNEMNIRQQEIDSREEYDRVGQYCEKNARRAFKAQHRHRHR